MFAVESQGKSLIILLKDCVNNSYSSDVTLFFAKNYVRLCYEQKPT